MALPYKSIAVESDIEFVNLQPLDVNPLMSKCDIKVFYLGKNRNRFYVTKDIAIEMAKTLRGCPIVGYFKESKDDFTDHGEQVILDDEGIHFNTLTKPYGFVSPDAQVWFQDFEDEDKLGNTITRTYLCTTGYLWTGQYKEAQKIYEDGGKPQSMELDAESLRGVWSEDIKDNVEFFIVSDAIFSKLCILGDDVEPCFEGASVTESSSVKTRFTLDKKYKQTLFTMMQELQNALKGENKMGKDKATAEQQELEAPASNFSAEQDKINKSSLEENKEIKDGEDSAPTSEFKKEDKEDKTADSDSEDKKEEETESEKDKKEEEEEKKKEKPAAKSALESEYESLKANFSQMQKDYQTLKESYDSLVQFKNSIEDQKKDELIAKFFMISDEDKKEIIENKSKFTLDEIKQKLAVIGFEKGVNFNLEQNQDASNNKNTAVTFNLDTIGANNPDLPDWVKAVKDTEKEF